MLTKISAVCVIIFALLCVIAAFSTWKTRKLEKKVEQKKELSENERITKISRQK
ncbi:preprotein translocase subunit SecG [Lactobacillus colini]|uniref:Preprotein translocase subunit SecG n=1 Tax=Lactobacillus colini TaxID=1819254 RepID=A0ABS4MEX5_9LACO|nr:hypothetical protein [Lactobacillus colini]MBP2057917.1 preprotein translocase subunit SecG [Lactobacillus colini]